MAQSGCPGVCVKTVLPFTSAFLCVDFHLKKKKSLSFLGGRASPIGSGSLPNSLATLKEIENLFLESCSKCLRIGSHIFPEPITVPRETEETS